MQYMALIYSDLDKGPKYGSPEFGPMMAEYQAVTQTYIADKVYVSGDGLQPPSTATTIRLRNGKVETMDGPFAESKEQLGGYYVFECANLDEAIKYAAMIPAAKFGAVEVRPIIMRGG